MKISISLLIFCLLHFVDASACSCGIKSSIRKEWYYSTQVFIGEVISINDSAKLYNNYGNQVRTATIRIIETFKLDLDKNQPFRTFILSSGGSCDSHFTTGEKYLIYASANSTNSFLISSICSRTELLYRVKKQEIEQLRKLYRDSKKKHNSLDLNLDDKGRFNDLERCKSENNKLSITNSLLVSCLVILTIVIPGLFFIIYRLNRKKKRILNESDPQGLNL